MAAGLKTHMTEAAGMLIPGSNMAGLITKSMVPD